MAFPAAPIMHGLQCN